MTRDDYLIFENYMLSCMEDSAHDKEHIYRVMYMALEIAQTEKNVDYDVLICACLLHDVGRKEQFEDPKLCHAQAGADKAYHFLKENGFSEEFAKRVSKCIRTHRFRAETQPESIEAKILFDADKIDVTGAVGIARTLVYKGQVGEPLYSVTEDGSVADGTMKGEGPSFFQEYKYKLENIYTKFYTARGAEIAKSRQEAAAVFYENMLREVREPYEKGKKYLERVVENNE